MKGCKSMSNKTKAKLKSGGIALGHFVLEFATPGIGQMMANAGCDYVIFDMEHSSFTQDMIRWSILSAKAADVNAVVRVPYTDSHFMARALDAGAEGLMIPKVESRDQVLRIMDYVKYPPEGNRGGAFGIAHDDYKGGDMAKLAKGENDDTLIIVQTETVKSVENVDEILSVEGVDVAWLGQCDMTFSMGIPGQYDNPKFLRIMDKLINACEKHGVALGYIPVSIPEAIDVIEKGVRCISYSADIFLYGSALSNGVQGVKDYIEKRK